mmetsp:Transcript_37034/g.82329  ORF Transcript_37034/g.82329 Transcript_37034/m.82329 type:complete len:125 (-) Transcript_37034:91-465(-)
MAFVQLSSVEGSKAVEGQAVLGIHAPAMLVFSGGLCPEGVVQILRMHTSLCSAPAVWQHGSKCRLLGAWCVVVAAVSSVPGWRFRHLCGDVAACRNTCRPTAVFDVHVWVVSCVTWLHVRLSVV